ncbi:hypothetical protein [Enterovirga sp.]|mgnify:CR=1 FL=1|uniref:hypothetical protein n=1 Tax=Enterovirga sp. TaxID=2026350 RepID=UPI002B6B2324|nr:hypothetical protein [Enterovirga sp.]HMO30846.1 hypothetical protein [Enterovirga sp.]
MENNLRGIRDIIAFTSYLRDRKIWHAFQQTADDYITVRVDILNSRIEVDFYEDHVEYNHFDGREDILTDQIKLFAMLRHFVEG